MKRNESIEIIKRLMGEVRRYKRKHDIDGVIILAGNDIRKDGKLLTRYISKQLFNRIEKELWKNDFDYEHKLVNEKEYEFNKDVILSVKAKIIDHIGTLKRHNMYR